MAVLVLAAGGRAACPPDCFRGTGPAASDCLVQYGRITAARTTCTDGDPACDADGLANGVCTIAVDVCLNEPSPGCTPDAISGPTVAPVTSDAARALASAVGALDPARPGCVAATAPVALRPSLGGVRPASARVVLTVRGRRTDRDRLTFTCTPSAAAPPFAAAIQPIFSARCATIGCHVVAPPNSTPPLEAVGAWAAIVGVASRNVPSLALVAPGDVARSYLARKILGKRIVDRTVQMPQGCPHVPPAGGCLTTAEQAAIVGWIAGGAPND